MPETLPATATVTASSIDCTVAVLKVPTPTMQMPQVCNLQSLGLIMEPNNINIELNPAATPTPTPTSPEFKMMTMDITKTEPGLVGLSSNQQQQQQQSGQQQQAASMNSNSGNNVGQNANNGCNSNGGGVNSGNGNGNNGGNNNSNSNVQSIAAAANNNNNNNNGSQLCAGCGKHIQDRYLLRALDMLWHEDCLKCGCCDCRLGEVGSTLYKTGNLMLCKLDYFRLFGNTGYCAACSKVIFAFEMVMRARTNVYHLHCFACQQCNYRLCVGDRFYLCMNKILCEYDYEEWLLFATIAAGVPGAADELPGGGPGEANMGVVVGIVNSPCTPGDHNNNKGPQTPTGGDSPFAAAATAAAEEPARGVQTKKSPGHGRA